jgi:hypothetical protein
MAENILLGYTCPSCGMRVPVLRSSEPPKDFPKEIVAVCQCGTKRKIGLEEVQRLDVWRVKSA